MNESFNELTKQETILIEVHSVPLGYCLFYKSDLLLPVKGNNKIIPQSEGIAGDKRVLDLKSL